MLLKKLAPKLYLKDMEVLHVYCSLLKLNYNIFINVPITFCFVLDDMNLGAAVAMLGGSTGYSSLGINGVVRFVQINENECVVDGTIDGLSPGKHGLHIYECGNLSNGCERFKPFYHIIKAPFKK